MTQVDKCWSTFVSAAVSLFLHNSPYLRIFLQLFTICPTYVYFFNFLQFSLSTYISLNFYNFSYLPTYVYFFNFICLDFYNVPTQISFSPFCCPDFFTICSTFVYFHNFVCPDFYSNIIVYHWLPKFLQPFLYLNIYEWCLPRCLQICQCRYLGFYLPLLQ